MIRGQHRLDIVTVALADRVIGCMTLWRVLEILFQLV